MNNNKNIRYFIVWQINIDEWINDCINTTEVNVRRNKNI